MDRAQSLTQAKKLVAVALLCGIVFMAAAPVFAADHHRDAKQQIEQLELQWRNANLTGDASMMDKLLSDDFVGISWNGQVSNKMSQLDRLRAHKLTVTKMDISDLKVKVIGTVAIVTSATQVEGTSDGAPVAGLF